jgi:hypothetical protein
VFGGSIWHFTIGQIARQPGANSRITSRWLDANWRRDDLLG